jgi:ABC-type microcin C transport system permease subunit YejB
MGDIKDAIEDVVDKAEQASDRLISVIAVLVAVLATVMALFSIKGGNIGQAMAQAQARSVNAWAYFQAKSTKQGLAESMLDQLAFERERGVGLAPEAAVLLDKKIEFYREKVERYAREKEEIKQQAEAYEQEYERLNFHDDQFDIAEAGMTVGLAVLGVAALTRRKWLVWFALVFAGVGLASGAAGFVGGSFHLDFVATMLS